MPLLPLPMRVHVAESLARVKVIICNGTIILKAIVLVHILSIQCLFPILILKWWNNGACEIHQYRLPYYNLPNYAVSAVPVTKTSERCSWTLHRIGGVLIVQIHVHVSYKWELNIF